MKFGTFTIGLSRFMRALNLVLALIVCVPIVCSYFIAREYWYIPTLMCSLVAAFFFWGFSYHCRVLSFIGDGKFKGRKQKMRIQRYKVETEILAAIKLFFAITFFLILLYPILFGILIWIQIYFGCLGILALFDAINMLLLKKQFEDLL